MRRGRTFIGAVAIALTGIPLAAPAFAESKPKPEHIYGLPPTWDEFRRIGEAAITARLIDPESARITWLTGYVKGEFKPFLSARVAGYIACGSVNARNRLGGYTGATTFVVVIDFGRALFAEMDPRMGGMYDAACAKAIDTGAYPPPPARAAISEHGTAPAERQQSSPSSPPPPPPPPLANVDTGLAIRVMPEGAYVAAVVPGSPAAIAGLKPGMVIASVNAIPLAGMGDAMPRVVDAAGGHATFTLIGGGTIKLGGPK